MLRRRHREWLALTTAIVVMGACELNPQPDLPNNDSGPVGSKGGSSPNLGLGGTGQPGEIPGTSDGGESASDGGSSSSPEASAGQGGESAAEGGAGGQSGGQSGDTSAGQGGASAGDAP